jgi:hypothetical protein
MALKSYDPKEFVIIVAGQIITGLADGTFINAGRLNDTWSDTAGADGEVARAKSNDKRGEFTITVMQSSAANDFLSALAVTDELANTGIVPVLVQDLNGTTVVAGAESWIVKPANVEGAKEITNREWLMRTSSMDIFGGGSS